MSVEAYNSRSALADKVLRSDGSITAFDGTPIAPPDERRAVEYNLRSALADKVLKKDGSIVTLAEAIPGGDGPGGAGPPGAAGWSGLLRKVADGDRIVLQLYDWTGGGIGNKPTTTGYLGPSGITSNIALAIDIKGDKGDPGTDSTVPGPKGDDGAGVLLLTTEQHAALEDPPGSGEWPSLVGVLWVNVDEIDTSTSDALAERILVITGVK